MIFKFINKLIEKEKIPFIVARAGVWLIVFLRHRELKKSFKENGFESTFKFLEKMNSAPIAIVPEKANEQHYEIPASFYEHSLGKNYKYSSAFYSKPEMTLSEAEEAMLSLYVQRGMFQDGQDILELGCGWGSLTIFLAKSFPTSKITALSNSQGQRKFIEERLRSEGCTNVTVVTDDINNFSIDKKFDRIVSVEMFEHLRNWEKLFSKINSWLKEDGKLFFHIFTHSLLAYQYDTDGDLNWMGKYFFSGGMMPSRLLPLLVDSNLKIEHQWDVSGTHYEKTARDWRLNMDKNRDKLIPVLGEIYGTENALTWFVRWKLFYLACEVLFGFKNGTEWGVSHYLFSKRSKA